MNRNRNFFKNRGALLLENSKNVNNKYNINPRVIRDFSCRKPSFNEAKQANAYLTLIKKKMIQTFEKQKKIFESKTKNNTNYNSRLIQNRMNYRKIYRGGNLGKKNNFRTKKNFAKRKILDKEKQILDSLNNLNRDFDRNSQGLKKLQNKKVFRNNTFDVKKNRKAFSRKNNFEGKNKDKNLYSEKNINKKYGKEKSNYEKRSIYDNRKNNFGKENNFENNYKKEQNFENGKNNFNSKKSNFYNQLDNTINADQYLKNMREKKPDLKERKNEKKNILIKKKNYRLSLNNKKIKRPVPKREKLNDEKISNDFLDMPLNNLGDANQKIYEEMENLKKEEIYKCNEGCGRSFIKSVLSKHEKICKKIFQKKRKKFNSLKQREPENIKLKKVKKIKNKNKNKIKKIPKWKLESAKLRTLLGQARGKDVENTKEAQIVKDFEKSDMVKCNTCQRSFNKIAADRHIPFCEKRARNNTFKARAPKKKKKFKR